MKQLLLLAVIHLLIFHQYKKDKSEVLAPKKNTDPLKTGVLTAKNDYLFRANEDNTTDSLQLSTKYLIKDPVIRPIWAIHTYNNR